MTILLKLKKQPNENAQLFEKRRSPRLRGQLLSVLCFSIGHFLDGTVLAYTSTAIPSMQNSTQLNLEDMTFVRSFHSLGATLGCLLAGFVMNHLGRRGSTLFLTVPAYFSGYILMGSAKNLAMIVVGRFLTGIGLGLTLCIPTVYIVEISSSAHRGILGVLPNLFCQLGILATYIAGHWLDWKLLSYAISGICLPFAIGIWWIPESPVYLLRKNKMVESETALRFFDRTINDLPDAIRPENRVVHGTNFFSAIRNRDNFKPFLCGFVLMGFFQGTGYPTLIGSTVDLFQEASDSISAYLASIIIGVVIVVFAMVSVPLAKNCNSKAMLIVSAVGVSICLFTFGSFCYFKETETMKALAWLPLANFVIYVGFFMIGFGSISWLIVAEILPPDIRATAYPIAIAFSWLVNFSFTFAYDQMIAQIYCYGTLWIYATCTTISITFIIFFLPNTMNKTTEEIAAFYK